MRHGIWDVAAVFPGGLCAGLHAPAAVVLANPYAHVARLRRPYADHQSVAAAKAMDLNRYFRRRHRSASKDRYRPGQPKQRLGCALARWLGIRGLAPEQASRMPVGNKERHHTGRIGWLRAAVLGANDGILSTSSLALGVAAAHATHGNVLVAWPTSIL